MSWCGHALMSLREIIYWSSEHSLGVMLLWLFLGKTDPALSCPEAQKLLPDSPNPFLHGPRAESHKYFLLGQLKMENLASFPFQLRGSVHLAHSTAPTGSKVNGEE